MHARTWAQSYRYHRHGWCNRYRYLHRCLWQVSRHVVFVSWEPFRRLYCSSCLDGTAQCCDIRTGRTDGELRMPNENATTRQSDRCESSGARAHKRHTGTVADKGRVTVTSWRVYLWSVGGELRLVTEPQCARNGSRCSLAQQLITDGAGA